MRSLLVTALTWILIACGVFLFVRGGLDYWQSKSAQQQIAAEWNQEQREDARQPQTTEIPKNEPAAPVSPDRETEQDHFAITPRRGAALARLAIPRLDTVLYVVEGDDDGDLKRGPGHLTGSAMPGQDGNCIIAGHRDTHFRILKNIRKGDEIFLSRDGRQFRYRVDELSIVSPDNMVPLRPTHEPVLNLITCYPFYYVGSAPRRFIVHARLETEQQRAAR